MRRIFSGSAGSSGVVGRHGGPRVPGPRGQGGGRIGRVAVVLLLLVAAWGATHPALAQDDDAGDLPATVAALEDRVSALETQVAELADAGEEGGDDVARSAGPTPTPGRTGGGDRDEEDGGTAATTPTGDVSTRDNPIPLGEAAASGDYTVAVLEVVPDATDLILAENRFNEPPAVGKQFFMATIEVSYTGSETGNPGFDLNVQAVGDGAVGYTTFEDSCGVTPDDEYDANELFPGGTVAYNVCWAIDQEDAASLVMFVEPLFAFDAEPVFFALRGR